MALKIEHDGSGEPGSCKLAFDEDLTIYCIAELKDALSQEISLYERFDIDLSQVEEIDSSGIQLLLAFTRELGQKEKEFSVSSMSSVASNFMDAYGITEQFSAGRTR